MFTRSSFHTFNCLQNDISMSQLNSVLIPRNRCLESLLSLVHFENHSRRFFILNTFKISYASIMPSNLVAIA